MADFTEFPIPTKLFNPAEFAGADGREVELQTTATHVQWRYVGTATWTDLVALSTLEGAPGADGREAEFRQSATHLQWRLVGDVAWIDLVPLADLIPQDTVTSTDVTSIAVVTEYPATEDPAVLYIKVPV